MSIAIEGLRATAPPPGVGDLALVAWRKSARERWAKGVIGVTVAGW